jgi:hypothetical protein
MTKKRAPIFRMISDRGGQYIVNIANVPDGTVELYKQAEDGRRIPVADVGVPKDIRINPDPIEFRNYVKKEIRRIEAYIKAKNEFEKSDTILHIDEKDAVAKGILPVGEDKRRLPGAGGQGNKKPKKAKMGRPGFFNGVDFEK